MRWTRSAGLAATMPGALAVAVAMLAAGLAACGDRAAPPPQLVVKALGPASMELIPAAGLPPYCLVFTIAERGLVRQLTPLDPNEAIACPGGAPIGGTRYQIPRAEGPVRIYAVFADRIIDGHPIAVQLRELGNKPGFSAMDLRAPGNVRLERAAFTPAP